MATLSQIKMSVIADGLHATHEEECHIGEGSAAERVRRVLRFRMLALADLASDCKNFGDGSSYLSPEISLPSFGDTDPCQHPYAR